MLALDAALRRLERRNPRRHRVVLLRFYAGLPVEETARALGVSVATVKLDWRLARAWLCARLRRELARGAPATDAEHDAAGFR